MMPVSMIRCYGEYYSVVAIELGHVISGSKGGMVVRPCAETFRGLALLLFASDKLEARSGFGAFIPFFFSFSLSLGEGLLYLIYFW